MKLFKEYTPETDYRSIGLKGKFIFEIFSISKHNTEVGIGFQFYPTLHIGISLLTITVGLSIRKNEE